MGKKGTYDPCGSGYRLTVGRFLEILKQNQPYDLAMSLLGIYQKTAYPNQRDICILMFIVALFTIAKNWNQPTDEWIMKIGIYMCVCMYTYIHKYILMYIKQGHTISERKNANYPSYMESSQ